jgi:nicotinamide mononucleotide transporter
VQLYGWWFWNSGGEMGTEPKIGNWSWKFVSLLLIPVSLVTLGISYVLNVFTDANMAFWDTLILCLSILAQFLLDRKQQKHWMVWGFVNILSIYVYSSMELWLTTLTYVVLLLNVPYGYYLWKKETKTY